MATTPSSPPGSAWIASPEAAAPAPPSRRRGRGLTLALLAAVLLWATLGLLGVEPSLPTLPGSTSEPPLPGVRARAVTIPVRVGASAPAGGELAYAAVDPTTGNLVVTDKRRQSVLRFGTDGRLLSEWGPRLGADVTLQEPAGIAVSPDGTTTYVVDRGSQRLVQLDMSGRAQATMSLQPLDPYGLNGAAIDPFSGSVVVADTGRNRLLMLAPPPGNRVLREIGRPGKDLGQFTQPYALAFSPIDGALLVTDWENARVQRWAPDLTAATNAWPTGYRSFGIAVDFVGRVYVADAERRRIQAFTPKDGTLLGEVGVPGTLPLDLPPIQLTAGNQAGVLYAVGPSGIMRIDWDNVPPPPQGGGSLGDVLDPTTLAAIAGLAAVGLLVVDWRRRHAPLSRKGG